MIQILLTDPWKNKIKQEEKQWKKMQFLDILTCIISVYILFLFSFVRTDESNDIAVKLEIVYKDEGQNVTLKCSNGSL